MVQAAWIGIGGNLNVIAGFSCCRFKAGVGSIEHRVGAHRWALRPAVGMDQPSVLSTILNEVLNIQNY